MESLRSADVEDLPVIVRFLLQSGMGLHAKRIVQQLRTNLHFVTVADVRAAKPDRKQKGKSAAAADSEALVLDAMRTGLRFQNVIAHFPALCSESLGCFVFTLMSERTAPDMKDIS